MNCNDVITQSALYLSGEIDSPEFRAHLESCPACCREIRKQAAFDALLREGILAEEIHTDTLQRRIYQATRQATRRSRWIYAASGIAAALLIAIAGYITWSNMRIARIYSDAALDHRREVIEHQPRTWSSDIDELVQRRGLPPSISQIAQAGYHFDRGKYCRLNGRGFLHLVYSKDGGEYSVFLRGAAEEPFSSAERSSDSGPEHVVSFQTEQCAAMIVTDQSAESAKELARLAASVL
jgi:anti-sigma factor RsiW